MKEKLQLAMKDAMRAKDKIKLDAIRQILAAIQYEEMEKKVEPLPNDAITVVLQREFKKRKEELEFADQASRGELKDKINQEMQIIESFLPKQMSAPDLEAIIVNLKQQTPDLNMGGLMKVLREKYSGQFDGKLASELAKKLL